MADNTKIEWTEATWNPITGCTVHSPGCTNCYAMQLAGTRLQYIPSRAGLTKPSKAGPVWTGEVRFNEEWLTQPLRWKRPRMIFVCAHGDLFHEAVPDEWIDQIFAVMALCPQHTFQVLTKRSDRMRDYVTAHRWQEVLDWQYDYQASGLSSETPVGEAWPLPNVWLGVSVEDQARADQRIPDLLATPAAVRWISAEPLLGPVDLTCITVGDREMDAINPYTWDHEIEQWRESVELPEDWKADFEDEYGRTPDGLTGPMHPTLDWIVVGGESGPGARPMHDGWALSLVNQCRAAGVAVFVKQLSSGGPKAIKDIEQFPEGLRVREFPHAR